MLRVFLILLVPFFCYELFASIHMTLVRAAFPFADNGWADHAQIYAFNRMAHGGPAFTSPLNRDSYIYGPLYLWIVNGVRALFGWPPAIVVLRTISMSLGMLSLVPLLVVTALVAPLAGIERRLSLPFVIAIVATVAIGICTITHDLTYDTLHPDALLFLLASISLALYFALAKRAVSPWWLAAFVPLCVLAFLTKANAVLFVFVPIAALLVAKCISLRAALVTALAAAAATLATFVLLPSDITAWTILIPASQPILLWRSYQIFVDAFTSRDGVYVFFIGAMLFATVITGSVIAEKSGKPWAILIGGMIAGAILTAVPAYLKQGGTWNNLVLIAVCCIPFTAILAALPFRPRAEGSLSPGLAFLSAFVLTEMTASFSLSNQQMPLEQDVEHLSAARTYATKLCRDHPQDKIYVLLLPDIFFGCPNALYHSQWAIGELTWAYPKYDLGVPIDPDPHTRYVAFIESPHFGSAAWLKENYHPIWSTPSAVGEWYINYDHVPFTFYERNLDR